MRIVIPLVFVGHVGRVHCILHQVVYVCRHGIFNPLNAEIIPICHPLTLLGTHHILHVSRIRVKVWVDPCFFHVPFPYLCGSERPLI
jgi:hypothetical protein